MVLVCWAAADSRWDPTGNYFFCGCLWFSGLYGHGLDIVAPDISPAAQKIYNSYWPPAMKAFDNKSLLCISASEINCLDTALSSDQKFQVSRSPKEWHTRSRFAYNVILSSLQKWQVKLPSIRSWIVILLLRTKFAIFLNAECNIFFTSQYHISVWVWVSERFINLLFKWANTW